MRQGRDSPLSSLTGATAKRLRSTYCTECTGPPNRTRARLSLSTHRTPSRSNLTALAPAQYYDATGRAIPCPDPAAGLFIRARNGDLVQVSMPSDCLAFQIGEASQIHSGGVLQATPHCVRAAAAPGVSRATMAVFMGPHWTQAMACPGLQEGDRKPTSVDADASSKAATWARVLKGARGELLPRGVPTLESRWDGPSQTFGGFTDKTLGSYY